MKKTIVIKGRPALAGIAEGYAMVCPNSIQGWAGIDPRSGKILEKGHIHEGETCSMAPLSTTNEPPHTAALEIHGRIHRHHRKACIQIP